MISSLYRMAAGPIEREELRRQLRAGPWCWPPESDERRMAWAETIAGGVPPATSGRALGVAVSGRASILWALELGRGPTAQDSRHRAVLGPDAMGAWRTAVALLPGALPVLWRSISQLAEPGPTVIQLAASDEAAYRRVVDGPSFGLTFSLLLASAIFDIPLPGDLAASAELLPDGTAGPVRGLAAKIEGLRHLAPRVTRLLVAAEQASEDEAQAAAGKELHLIPVSSAAEALHEAFRNRLAHSLVSTTDPSQRDEVIGSLFRLSFAGRRIAIDWTPIEAAAGLALEWDGLTDDQRYRLEFARAVAARHERNAGTLPTPTRDWLDRQPRPIQVGVAAHMLQQAADTGVPDPAIAQTIATPFLPESERSAYQPQLRLLGALARLWAVTGRPREALELQERLARAFFDAFEYGEMSFQFSEWFRLSGAVEDRDAFETADQLYQRVLTLGAFGIGGSPFVELARAKAMVMLRIALDDEPVRVLERLATASEVPHHVRWSAARWAIRACLDRDAGERAGQMRAQLDAAASVDCSGSAAKQDTLAALDACLRNGEDCVAQVERLRGMEPGLIGHLANAAPSGAAAYIARFYPY